MSGSNNLVVLERKNGIGIVHLGGAHGPGVEERIAILTLERMEALRAVVSELAASDLKAVIFAGMPEAGFCGGADVSIIGGITDPKKGEELSVRGQEIFSQIENLKMPTIAAVTGACVGGGCELVLACGYRILANSADTKIGLPEIKLGIIPGFGGTQRLPRTIGLPNALDIILAGKVVNADKAKRIGLADELAGTVGGSKGGNYRAVMTRAEEIALSGKLPKRAGLKLADRLLTYTGFGRSVVVKKASAALYRETKGLYPAPPKALEVAVYGLSKGRKLGYPAEAKALGETAATPESKSLVHLYHLTESAGKFGKAAKKDVVAAPVAVLGGGVMGAGIALAFLQKGHPVTVLEPVKEAQVRAREHISSSITKRERDAAAAQKTLEKLKITETLADVASASLVVEAIVEDLSIKQQIFAQLAGLVPSETILASNTSSLSLDDIAQNLHGSGPERFLGMHFFNPAEKMPLVEIVRGEATSERNIVKACAFASALGKYPAVVEDVPGFLVNRILSAYIAESGQLLSEGYSIAAIDDAAVKFGMPMGPFRMLDEVGLDVAAKVQEVLTAAYGERMHAPEFPKKLTQQQRFGKKRGGGFYNYVDGKPEADAGVYGLLGLSEPKAEAAIGVLQDRLILSLVNEAVGCLDQGVAGQPSAYAAGQIDLATVMGMGFPPFRGGVIRYAETLGAAEVLARMKRLAAHGLRFAPVPGIERRAAAGQSFYNPA